MEDWGAVRKRLEEMDEDHFDPNDIRAALERVEELEQANRTINRAQMAMVKRAEAAEAKLARVVELHYAKMDSCETCGGYWPCLTYLAAKGDE